MQQLTIHKVDVKLEGVGVGGCKVRHAPRSPQSFRQARLERQTQLLSA